MEKFFKIILGFLGAATLALFTGFVIAGLSASGVISLHITHVCFWIAFAIAFTVISIGSWLLRKSILFSSGAALMSIVIVGGGLWWLNSWLTVQKQAQDSANKVPVPVARSAPSPQVPIVKTVHQIQIIQPTHTRDKVGAQSSPSKVTAKDNGIAVGGISQGAGSALSFNQTGGITAGTVNFAPQDRHLSDEQRATIKTIVNGRVCKITMMGYLQNVEDAQSFALERRDAFKLAGCTVPDGVVPLMNPNGPRSG